MSRENNVGGEDTPETAKTQLHSALTEYLSAQAEARAANIELAARMDELHRAYATRQEQLEEECLGKHLVVGKVLKMVRDENGSWYLKEVTINEELEVTSVHLHPLNALTTDADEFMGKSPVLKARLPGEPANQGEEQMFQFALDDVEIDPDLDKNNPENEANGSETANQ